VRACAANNTIEPAAGEQDFIAAVKGVKNLKSLMQ
jgi:hypothetical protein